MTKKIPKVRLAKPKGKKSRKPYQLRYTCPKQKREVRLSTGTHDEGEALRLRDELVAKLTLGLPTQTAAKRAVRGPEMPWEDFREEYTRLKVATFRSENAMDAAEIILDVCESIVSPATLADMADLGTLSTLQDELLAGTGSKKGPRSPNTVNSYLGTVKAALNWAHKKKRWLPGVVVFEPIEVDEDDAAKGRPLTVPEYQSMLKACDTVCKREPASWKFLLRGIWESGLRLGEAMLGSWDDDSAIRPLKTRNGGYLLRIPATCQKNRKTQEVPTIPAFGELIATVPADQQEGWVFSPAPRREWAKRLSDAQVGRIISEIGEEAGVIVNDDGKFASAHDLRRSFGQRMAEAGVGRDDLQAIMRHSDFRTTEKYYLRSRAVSQAERIAGHLGQEPNGYLGTTEAKNEKRTHIEST